MVQEADPGGMHIREHAEGVVKAGVPLSAFGVGDENSEVRQVSGSQLFTLEVNNLDSPTGIGFCWRS